MQSISLLFAGDLAPTQSNYDLFANADLKALVGSDLLKIFISTDFLLFNLEVPLTDTPNPISKCGPNLIAPTSTIDGIKAINPTLIGLANNHILDQDEQGLYSTINILKSNNIDSVGAGKNLQQAAQPYIFERDGIKIGIYACAEYEFSIADRNKAGANSFDPLESIDHINCLKAECDFVVVLYHGGKEHYRYPSPNLQKVCRKIAKKGADLVICQHSHCIGCYEEYEGSTIIYGQGNFIFDYSESEFWQTSLLVKVNIGGENSIEYIPIVKKDNGVCLAECQEGMDILAGFNERSLEILKDGFVEGQYRRFAEENIQLYLRSLSGFGKWLSRIDRKLLNGMLLRRKYNKNQLLEIQNYIECEAHRELLLAGLLAEKRL